MRPHSVRFWMGLLVIAGCCAAPAGAAEPVRPPDFTATTPAGTAAARGLVVPEAIAAYSSPSGTPMHLRGPLGALESADPVETAQAFLRTSRSLLKLSDPDHGFEMLGVIRDGLGMAHVKFQHVYRGVPVWPEQVIVHVNAVGQVYCFNGLYQDFRLGDVKPAVPEAVAADSARTAHPCPVGEQATVRLVIYNFHIEAPRLTWEVELAPAAPHPYRYRVFVDALTGALLNSIDEVYTGYATTSTGVLIHTGGNVTLHTWHHDDGFTYLVDASKNMFPGSLDIVTLAGTIAVFDLSNGVLFAYIVYEPNGNNVFDDTFNIAAAGTASYHVSRVYDYFYGTHNWTSFNNAGGAIPVFVNDYYDPDNAHYANNSITLGAGGELFYNWAAALDLTAHEYAHGVTDATCRLVYQYESGAMNESMSDAIGCLVDTANWTLGEAILRPNDFGATAMRDMADPHNGQPAGSPFWQPAHMDEYVSLPANQDNGGVHVNCGIPNRAFQLVAASLGRGKAERIYFRAWIDYFTTSTDFAAARLAVEQAAIDLHGNNSTEHNAVKSAFDAVGIGGGVEPVVDNVLYFPLAVNFEHHGKTFDGSMWVINTADVMTYYNLDLYNAAGTAIATTSLRSLAAHAMEGWLVPEGANLGIAVADNRIIGISDHQSPDRHVAVATTPAEIYTNAIFIPHIPSTSPDWFSACAVSNVTDAPSNVVFLDNAGYGIFFDLAAPDTTAFFDFEQTYLDLFGVVPDPAELGGLWGFCINYDLDQEKVLEPNLVGAEIFGVKATNDCAGLNLDPFVARTLLFSHIANPPVGWWTGIAMVSLATDPDPADAVTTHPLLVTAYSAGGEILAQTVIEIPYLGKQAYLAHTWWVDAARVIPDDAVWIMVSSMLEGHPITGYELFGVQSPPAGIDSLAGLEAAKFVSQRLLFPRVANGNAAGDGLQQWTGIAVINPNATSAELTYRLYNWAGTLIATRPRTVSPYMKDIGFASELFTIGDFWGWVTVDSNVPVTGFELFGYQDSRAVAGVTVFYE